MLKNNNLWAQSWVERIYTKSLVNAIVGTGKKLCQPKSCVKQVKWKQLIKDEENLREGISIS